MAKIIPTSGHEVYDLQGEAGRLAFADVVIGARRLNRGQATIRVDMQNLSEEDARVRAAWHERILPSTLPEDAPVIHLGWPTHGPFVLAPQGTYFDGYLGVGQKVLDEHHPNFRQMLGHLEDAGVHAPTRDRHR